MSIANHSENKFLLKLDIQQFSDDLPGEGTPTDEPIETNLETDPQQVETNEPPVATQEEEFDIIKHNKAEVKLPISERQTYLQKGYNYDKVKQRADELEKSVSYLDRVAKISGYQNTDELFQAIEQAEEQERVQQEAKQLGMDEEAYRQYVAPVNERLSTAEKRLEEMQKASLQREIDVELNELKKDENFPKYERDMWEIAIQHKMPLAEAYEFASLRGLKEQIPSLQQQAEQRVVDQIKSRQGKHVETHDENATVSLDLSPEEMAYAQRMGIAPEEYAKWK